MGGLVEDSHAKCIKRAVGETKGSLPYEWRHSLFDLYPGYALRAAAGCVSDDTFIHCDLTPFPFASLLGLVEEGNLALRYQIAR